jgi:hypothetical protein
MVFASYLQTKVLFYEFRNAISTNAAEHRQICPIKFIPSLLFAAFAAWTLSPFPGASSSLGYLALWRFPIGRDADVERTTLGVLEAIYEGLLDWSILLHLRSAAHPWLKGKRRLYFEDSWSVISNQSLSDHFQNWVENRVKPFRINWYPLPPPIKSLSSAKIRIHMLCVSSTKKGLPECDRLADANFRRPAANTMSL